MPKPKAAAAEADAPTVETHVAPEAYETAPPDEYVPVPLLVPYANNARTHDDAQIDQIRVAFRKYGVTFPALRDAKSLVAGHGRIMAAARAYALGEQLYHAPGKEAGGKPIPLGTYPCKNCDGWDDDTKRAYILLDNRIAEKAGWNLDLLKFEVDHLESVGFDLGSIGFGEADLSAIFSLNAPDEGDELSDNYSRKIAAPIYTPHMEAAPPIGELFDETKTIALIDEIDAAEDLPMDVREFLVAAAERHTVFNFSKIAEYYAHADAATQRLMEKSALVIIDFDAAIENGFVKMAEGMQAQAEASKASADA